MPQLTVMYFAKLREERGLDRERLETAAATPRALYDQLRHAHGLSAEPQSLRVAINEAFADWTQPLADGDTVVFIQPVAGG